MQETTISTLGYHVTVAANGDGSKVVALSATVAVICYKDASASNVATCSLLTADTEACTEEAAQRGCIEPEYTLTKGADFAVSTEGVDHISLARLR